MSQPHEGTLIELRKIIGDDEAYHGYFDDILEAKLMELDPEWMTAMKKEYKNSGNRRWCA